LTLRCPITYSFNPFMISRGVGMRWTSRGWWGFVVEKPPVSSVSPSGDRPG
jgi:hypothetical protein